MIVRQTFILFTFHLSFHQPTDYHQKKHQNHHIISSPHYSHTDLLIFLLLDCLPYLQPNTSITSFQAELHVYLHHQQRCRRSGGASVSIEDDDDSARKDNLVSDEMVMIAKFIRRKYVDQSNLRRRRACPLYFLLHFAIIISHFKLNSKARKSKRSGNVLIYIDSFYKLICNNFTYFCARG